MKSEKIIAIITGPSAVGKTTIAKEVLARLKNFKPSTTYTTRKKRAKDTEDKIMHYISEEEFKEKINNDELIEWAYFFGNFYGSTKKSVEEGLEKNNILMNIDIEGAKIIKKKISKNVSIFILPDNIDNVKKRIAKRNISENMKRLRLERVKKEIEESDKFDYKIINYDGKLEQTIEKVVKILEKY